MTRRSKMRRWIGAAWLATSLVLATSAFADATIPTRDIAGARDNPILKRYEGSFIVSAERKAFTDFSAPLSPLRRTDRTDSSNNRLYAPERALEVEGALTRLVYVAPADRSPLEVLRNYEDEAKAAGGEILFTCKGEGCGGSDTRSAAGGGGDSSLMMHFIREKDIKDGDFSNGKCALTADIVDQRYSTARMKGAGGDVLLTVHTYQLRDDLYCKALNGRTVAVVHIVEPKARDQKMTTVSAADMSKSLGATGKIALYGIYFDTGKADIKPDSDIALAEIGKLLAGDAKLAVAIVGHTDNVGGVDANVELSKRRADAVIRAVSERHKIAPNRMRAVGVGMFAPVASNDEDAGRAKNRRVELVKLN